MCFTSLLHIHLDAFASESSIGFYVFVRWSKGSTENHWNNKWTLQCLRSWRNFMPNADICAVEGAHRHGRPQIRGIRRVYWLKWALAESVLDCWASSSLPVRCKHKFLIRTNPVRIVYESYLDKGKLEPSKLESPRWTIPSSVWRLFVASLNFGLMSMFAPKFGPIFPVFEFTFVFAAGCANISIARVQILCLLLFLLLTKDCYAMTVYLWCNYSSNTNCGNWYETHVLCDSWEPMT